MIDKEEKQWELSEVHMPQAIKVDGPLRPGRMFAKEWEDVMSMINRGVIKERKDLQQSGMLMIYQQFDSVLEDIDGTLYTVQGWTPPGAPAYVDIAHYQ